MVDLYNEIEPAVSKWIPSVKSMVKSGSQLLLGSQAILPTDVSFCPNAQISCRNTSAVENLCCFNAPGGQLLQTQFWDTNPPTGPNNSWTLHGLWPDHCDGSFDQFCDDTRSYNNVTDILRSFDATDLLTTMETYWKDYKGHDSSLWSHEWSKHGTCVSTLDTSCYANYQPQEEVRDYFNAAVTIYKLLPSYEWLAAANIVPSTTKRYTKSQIMEVLEYNHGKPVTLGCKGGALDEIWYHFSVRGSVQTGEFIPTDPDGTKDTCPSTGIKYLPKTPSRPSPTHTTAAPRPTSTGPPFTGRGTLTVSTRGSKKGCIISGGTWYVSGTCATFYATEVDGGFTLASSRGNCAITKGRLLCSKSIVHGTPFGSDGKTLSFEGNSTFYADRAPRGWVQVPVYVSEEGHGTELEIEWQSAGSSKDL